MTIKTGIGQDSHRIVNNIAVTNKGNTQTIPIKALVLGGMRIEVDYHLEGNSDSDVILHAITNAISGVTAKPILGPVADALCREGVGDSTVYLKRAMKDLDECGFQISHVSICVECLKPKILPIMDSIRASIASILNLDRSDVAMTATTGEGLTAFGRGEGIQAFACVTVEK